MNTFELSRNFTNWAFENPEKVHPNHYAIYFFSIEHCNRLGGKEKFGFPSQMTMEAIGIKKHQTYIKYFNELIEFGFFKLIKKSKNQYSSNVISLVYALPKKGKALDKANINRGAKQIESIGQSIGQSKDSILKQVNQETIESIYNIYPTKCYNSERQITKGDKAKTKIKKILEQGKSQLELETIIYQYLNNCRKSKSYVKDFTTFLNNLPDLYVEEKKAEQDYRIKVVF